MVGKGERGRGASLGQNLITLELSTWHHTRSPRGTNTNNRPIGQTASSTHALTSLRAHLYADGLVAYLDTGIEPRARKHPALASASRGRSTQQVRSTVRFLGSFPATVRSRPSQGNAAHTPFRQPGLSVSPVTGEPERNTTPPRRLLQRHVSDTRRRRKRQPREHPHVLRQLNNAPRLAMRRTLRLCARLYMLPEDQLGKL